MLNDLLAEGVGFEPKNLLGLLLLLIFKDSDAFDIEDVAQYQDAWPNRPHPKNLPTPRQLLCLAD